MTAHTKITERPILFSGPMVRAILDWRKTQTRRVIAPPTPSGKIFPPDSSGDGLWFFRDGYYANEDHDVGCHTKCPFGVPGDHLWVRETFSPQPHLNAKAYFRADDPLVGVKRWNPSIHMPRWASRINLEITAIRIERLQDISTQDALSEGIPETWGDAWPMFGEKTLAGREMHLWDNHTTVENFAWLWDSINAKRGFPWSGNPWVWVIQFKRV